jgi:hypothetical protein
VKADIWRWVEVILEFEQGAWRNLQTEQVDEYQNKVMNVNLGLNDYGRMKFMLDMAT